MTKINRALVKITRPGMKIREKTGKHRFLAISPEFKAFVAKHRQILISTYNLIRREMQKLEAGKVVRDKEKGIAVKKAATGSYKGDLLRQIITLKVQAFGKEFFIKICKETDIRKQLELTKKADAYLKARKYTIHGFTVKVMKPHLLYRTPDGLSYILTDFYNKGEVRQLHEVTRPKVLGKIIVEVASDLNKIGFNDISLINAFYQPKKRTILLFDIEQLQRGN